jgi:hypothetical protein
MNASHKRKLAAGAVAAILVAGGGGALAARQLGGSSDTQAVVNDAAKQLGVSPTALSSALKKAYENRVDAAVAAGRLSKTEGDALKARIEANALPPLFFGGRHDGDRDFGFHHGGMRDDLAAAASYLGVTETKLASELQAGKTLAKVAADQGKTADGLVQALVDARTKELDAAVKAGRLTKADEQMLLSGLKQRITDFVNGTRPPFSHDGPPADRGFFHPPAL